jgi:hypothetical protein
MFTVIALSLSRRSAHLPVTRGYLLGETRYVIYPAKYLREERVKVSMFIPSGLRRISRTAASTRLSF